MRLTELQIETFKSYERETIPLEPVTFLVGPNGGGKTSVLQAIESRRSHAGHARGRLRRGNSSIEISRGVAAKPKRLGLSRDLSGSDGSNSNGSFDSNIVGDLEFARRWCGSEMRF